MSNQSSGPASVQPGSVSAWSLIKPYWVSEERRNRVGPVDRDHRHGPASGRHQRPVKHVEPRFPMTHFEGRNVHEFPRLVLLFSALAFARSSRSPSIIAICARCLASGDASVVDRALSAGMAFPAGPHSTASNATTSRTILDQRIPGRPRFIRHSPHFRLRSTCSRRARDARLVLDRPMEHEAGVRWQS